MATFDKWKKNYNLWNHVCFNVAKTKFLFSPETQQNTMKKWMTFWNSISIHLHCIHLPQKLTIVILANFTFGGRTHRVKSRKQKLLRWSFITKIWPILQALDHGKNRQRTASSKKKKKYDERCNTFTNRQW